MENPEVARIQPFKYEDALTGHNVSVEVSPEYSKIRVDDRVYYFIRETGKFDGTSGMIS